MARPTSPVKRHRQSLRRQERNHARKSAARTAIRHTRELMASGTQEEAAAAMRETVSILDRAARRGVFHRNTVARRKSRLMRQINAMGTSTQEAAPKRRTTAKAKASTAKTAKSKASTTKRTTRSKKS